MWMSIDSVKKEETDIILSAGNTGALFVIAKLNLQMIDNKYLIENLKSPAPEITMDCKLLNILKITRKISLVIYCLLFWKIAKSTFFGNNKL